jgi:hypothetical protein
VDISTGADPHDEAEFDLPDGEAMIQQFLAGLAKEVDNEYRGLSSLLATLPVPIGGAQPEALSAAEARSQGLVPEASEDTLRAFSVSEMKLYKHATTYKWKVDELTATIKLIKSVEFRVDDVKLSMLTCTSELLRQ